MRIVSDYVICNLLFETKHFGLTSISLDGNFAKNVNFLPSLVRSSRWLRQFSSYCGLLYFVQDQVVNCCSEMLPTWKITTLSVSNVYTISHLHPLCVTGLHLSLENERIWLIVLLSICTNTLNTNEWKWNTLNINWCSPADPLTPVSDKSWYSNEMMAFWINGLIELMHVSIQMIQDFNWKLIALQINTSQ